MPRDITKFYRPKVKHENPWKLSLRDKQRNVIDTLYFPTEEAAETARQEIYQSDRLLGQIEYVN